MLQFVNLSKNQERKYKIEQHTKKSTFFNLVCFYWKEHERCVTQLQLNEKYWYVLKGFGFAEVENIAPAGFFSFEQWKFENQD